jgi:hypothetical protein
MRPLYYRFRRSRGSCGDRGTAPSNQGPSKSARRLPQPGTGPGAPPSEDDRSPSPRMQDAAARLRSGEFNVHRIEALTGVPAALMKETAAEDAPRPPATIDAPDQRAAHCMSRATPT